MTTVTYGACTAAGRRFMAAREAEEDRQPGGPGRPAILP